MAIPPSGAQYEIAFEDRHVTVVEVGGGLRAYRVGDREVLDGYAVDAICRSGRGQVLAPWPNRIAGGTYEWDGEHFELALTEPENGNAIHGLVRWASWDAVEQETSRVLMEHVLHPQPGYPFALLLHVEYRLGADGLTVSTTAENVGDRACPFGAGHHPYLKAPIGRVDDLVVDGELLGPKVIDDPKRMDAPWRIVVDDVTVWADASWKHVQLFTGDPLPDVARRSLAVEPMTCPPNAFQTGEDVIRLEPGATFSGTWGIDVAG
jgi:aldose 1-epimerase